MEVTQNVRNVIITYQVITGNYSAISLCLHENSIITYQVITGNYSKKPLHMEILYDYNIPSNNRELQPKNYGVAQNRDYNIPSNNRELQLKIGIL